MSAFLHFYRTKTVWFLEHLIFMIIPMTFLMAYHASSSLQVTVMVMSALYMVAVGFLFSAKHILESFSLKYFRPALQSSVLPTLFFTLLIYIGKSISPQAYQLSRQEFFSPALYILVSVPLQEILFRGFCLWRCSLSFQNKWFIAFFNSALFAAYHLMYANWYFALGVFVVNLFWSWSFLKHPNLYVFILSHALLGYVFFSLIN